MVVPLTIETDDFRTRIPVGHYVAKTYATVFLSHGTGDARRDLSFTHYQEGDVFRIPETTNGHWYGLEPNGDMFSTSPAVIKAIRTGSITAKANKTDREYQQFQVREIDSNLYYQNNSFNEWYSLPSEWVSKIIWN